MVLVSQVVDLLLGFRVKHNIKKQQNNRNNTLRNNNKTNKIRILRKIARATTTTATATSI
jgi:hypothetical protein